MKRVRIHGIEFLILKGDITKIEAEAVVNPANSLMIMGGGVAGALKRVGGDEIEREAVKRAPVPVGKAIITSAGRLKAKFVIHAPTMERPAMRTTEQKVRAAVRAALEVADKHNINEIAFPGMGTGVGGLDPQVAARAIVSEIVSNWAGKSGKRIILVAYDEELYKHFSKCLDELAS